MSTLSPVRLVSLLRTGRLLDAQQLAEAERLQDTFADAKALGADLIRRGWLTPFQINQIFTGHGASLSDARWSFVVR